MSELADRRRERLLEAARGYLLLDMPDQALRELRAIDDPEACPFEIEQLRGEALREKGEFDDALIAFRRADELKHDDLTVLFGMAWCFKRIDKLDRAIESMERAYEAAPEEPVVLYNLACYFSLAGDKDKALSWLGRSIRMEKSLRNLIADEPDFDPLRNDPDFQLVAGLTEDVTAD